MLELLSKASTKLQPFRKLSYLLMIIFVIGIIISLLQTSTALQPLTNPYAILSFVACIWLLLFNLLLSIFDNIPSADNQSSFIKRFKIKMQRCFYHLLAFLFLGLTLVIVFLTIRMLRI